MANRYWVGGTAAWDGTAGTKWSTTSGGAGGSAVPTASDDVFFNAASGASTVTVTGSRVCLSLNCTGFTGTLTGTSTPVITISGNMTLASGMTFNGTSGPDLVFNSTTSRTITSAGKVLRSITFDGVGGSWALQDNLDNRGSGRTTTLTNGTYNLNGFTHSLSQFFSSNANTRVLAFGLGGMLVNPPGFIASVTLWNCATITGLTVTGTPAIEIALGSLGTATFNHGSTAGGSASNAISFTKFTDGTGTTDFAIAGHFLNLNFSNLRNSNTTIANVARTVYNSIIFSASATLSAGSSVTTLAGTGTQDITSNGATVDFPVTQNGVGGTVRLLDAFSTGTSNTYTLTNGTFNANNFNVTVGSFSSSNANVRTITMGSGAWVLTAGGTATVWNTATVTNLTFNKNTANITLISATGTTTRTFAGGGLTYNNLSIGGTTGASTLTLTGSNTFGTINSTKTVAQTVLFTSGTTTTVANWTVTGLVGQVLTLGSVTPGAQHTLTKTGGGTITVDYASISDSNATPATTWYATNSVDGGNNTGWTFTGGGGNFLMFF